MTTKGYHCAYDIHYHIVFPIKYRKALLTADTIPSLKRISLEIAERYEVDIEQMGTDLNHIHLLVSFHPKYSIGQFVRIYKSITAKQLFLTHPNLRKELWGGEFWSDGYYVSTVSERGNWKMVQKYVKNQGIPPTQLTLF